MHLREGEAATEVPATAELPLTLRTCRVGQDDVDVVAAVEVRRILREHHLILDGLFIFSRHEAQGIDGPNVPMLVLELHRNIAAVCVACLLDKVLLQQIGNIGL